MSLKISEISRNKKLPAEYLRGIGISEVNDSLRIEYRLEDGSLAPRQRIRIGKSSKDGFRWSNGDGEIVPYGLWKLKEFKKDYLIVVEGESDCWTLWHSGFSAIGLPGSSTSEKIQASYIEKFETLYLWQEPDDGGKKLIEGISKRIYDLNWSGTARSMTHDGIKDPSELWCSDKNRFVKNIKYAMLCAKKINKYCPPVKRNIMVKENRGRIDPDKIERASKFPLEELVDGKKYIACPFHKDEHPSMWVKNGFGFCFVCQKSANAIVYLQKTRGLGFAAAVEALQ